MSKSNSQSRCFLFEGEASRARNPELDESDRRYRIGFDLEREREMGLDAEAAAAARQAERLRKVGNGYYWRNRLGAAIDAYTEVPDASPIQCQVGK
ncbi:hypothetical protein NL676_002293 [Syzygium grande]|nr:hypothetical protein NL676_002293 [Syzygium grande]